ncbi:flagellar hook-associated protein FlgK [Pararhodobacter sp.]|uniref:flagellar hook-associated protein FlgK n=1 Tax=Pararhodobacter sp. TaxID=2127056 RepID=UPI002AFFD562|nr:flagellar hook-associated protein FlgK [Pararhodobacter sp.]
MSISSALSNAASGLSASARAVQVVSSNVANALTEGYAARQMELTSSTLGGVGGGVRVAGVTRLVDPVLLGLTRDAGAQAQSGGTTSAFWQRLESVVGLPDEGIGKAVSALETALISASERPDLDSRLGKVAEAAAKLVGSFDTIQTTVQTLRAQADAGVAHDVKTLNSGLTRVDSLNSEIVRLRASGQSTLGLEDERQALVSTLSDIIPMREYARADGRVTLFTAGGQLLLDLNPQEIGFSQSHAIDASMTLGNGLSGLTIGGRAVSAAAGGPLTGGRLAANFALRDEASVAAQTQLDTLAADLIQRFQSPATDATLAPGQPGLFTDAGAPLLGAPVAGIAGRIAVNTAVLPDEGGDLWKIRTGLGAAAPGLVGETAQIRNLLGALDRPISAGLGAPAVSFSGSLSEMTTQFSLQRQGAEDFAAQYTAHLSEMTQQMMAQGVDTDAEMQRLLAVEQAYAANARVIETADAMLRRLLEI